MATHVPPLFLTPTLGVCSTTPTLPLFRINSVPVLLLGCARLAVGTASLINRALCDLGTNRTFFGITAFEICVLSPKSCSSSLYWVFGFSDTNLQNQMATGEYYPNTLPRNSTTGPDFWGIMGAVRDRDPSPPTGNAVPRKGLGWLPGDDLGGDETLLGMPRAGTRLVPLVTPRHQSW